MNIFEKVSNLIPTCYNAKLINNVLVKYEISFPVKREDLFMMSSDDLKIIVDAIDFGDNDYFNLITSNLTLLKILNKIKDNPMFSERTQIAVDIINDFLRRINDYSNLIDSDELVQKYGHIISPIGINSQIYNLDEFQSFLDNLNLSKKDSGEIKKEVGKSNIRFAHQKINSNFNLELFAEADSIIKKEKGLLDRDFSDVLHQDSLSDEELNDYRFYSIVMALKSEVFKAKLNKYNEVVFNSSLKLINKYIDAYKALVKIKGEGNVLVR